jgi:hypothetical protein
MEPHTHPSYEQTLERIATILDVIAESQADLVKTQREQAEANAGIFKAHTRLAEAHTDLAKAQAHLTKTVDRVVERFEMLEIKHSETTDKLNALIDLMDRHQREHRERGM